MDFMGQTLMAFSRNNISYKNLYGVYWSHAMDNGISDAVDSGFDYIITTDYDSIFNAETVAQLVRLAEQNPFADAITTVQMGRFSGILCTTESGFLAKQELIDKPLVPLNTGHFGLTILRASSLKDLPRPWFWCKPSDEGTWTRNTNKLDDDIFFWDNFKKSGKTLFLAPRLVIGHLELLIQWPDVNMEGMYETTNHYYQYGPPQDVWK